MAALCQWKCKNSEPYNNDINGSHSCVSTGNPSLYSLLIRTRMPASSRARCACVSLSRARRMSQDTTQRFGRAKVIKILHPTDQSEMLESNE